MTERRKRLLYMLVWAVIVFVVSYFELVSVDFIEGFMVGLMFAGVLFALAMLGKL